MLEPILEKHDRNEGEAANGYPQSVTPSSPNSSQAKSEYPKQSKLLQRLRDGWSQEWLTPPRETASGLLLRMADEL